MTDPWHALAAEVVDAVESQLERVARAARDRLLGRRPARVAPYRGFGTPERVLVWGRVLEDPPEPLTADGQSRWRNLVSALRRLETDERPGVRVEIDLGGARAGAVSDQEGYFRAWVHPPLPLATTHPWHEASSRIVGPEADPAHPGAVHPVLVPGPNAAFGVISDIDDTVVRTDATDLVRVARAALLENAATRLPFHGVAAFYRALHLGAHAPNPIFYVSSGPWNFYDLLVEFLDRQAIPLGPLLLRDWGTSRTELLPLRHRAHKLTAIEEILTLYPTLPFILIGDSGQEDPEIYRDVVHRFPGRILAVYVRDVSRRPGRREAIAALASEVERAGSSLLLTDDTAAAARHAAEHGWIDPAQVDEVAGDREADAARPVP